MKFGKCKKLKLCDRLKNGKDMDIVPEVEVIRMLCAAHGQINLIKDSYELEYYEGINHVADVTKQCDQNMTAMLDEFMIQHVELVPAVISITEKIRANALQRCERRGIDCVHKIYGDSIDELDQRVYARTTDDTGGKPHRLHFKDDFQDQFGDKNFFDDCEYLISKMENRFKCLLPLEKSLATPCSDLLYDTAKLTNRFVDQKEKYEDGTLRIIQYLKHQPNYYLDRVIKNIQSIKVYNRNRHTKLGSALYNNHRFCSILDFVDVDYTTGKLLDTTLEI